MEDLHFYRNILPHCWFCQVFYRIGAFTKQPPAVDLSLKRPILSSSLDCLLSHILTILKRLNMIQTHASLSQNQDSKLGRETSQDDIEREPIPEKRRSWLAPTLFFVNTILIIVYGCVENPEVLINIGLALLGVVLEPFFRCLCIFVEELFQFQSRYKRNILNLFKQCFSGISWKPVIAVVLIDVIACAMAKKSSFELEDVISISSGISVGPLVAYLLKLNAQSDVDLSRLFEGRGLHPAYTLAWNYYINYLEKALPVFSRSFSDSNSPVQGQGSDECSDRDTQPKIQLSSKKLILLFSDNYKKEVELVDLDNHISKITERYVGGYKFPVYGLKYNGNEYKYVILYAEEPLESIKRIRDFERSKRVHADQVKDQVMFLYRTLVSEILFKDNYCRNKCIPILMSAAQSLENGGLVKLIMGYVKTEECASNAKEHTKSHAPPVKTGTDDTSELNLADWPSSSHIVDIDHAKGFPDYNPDQNSEKAKDHAPQLTKRKTIYRSRGYESDPDERMKKKLLSKQQKPNPWNSKSKSVPKRSIIYI